MVWLNVARAHTRHAHGMTGGGLPVGNRQAQLHRDPHPASVHSPSKEGSTAVHQDGTMTEGVGGSPAAVGVPVRGWR
jgi:hypothetical protein